ncbi:thioesterase [Bipolaris maydis]|nr:thioesterase [Bipolaris maydis]KAJ6192149.1 thioesterase [Bipolaris maydis]
MYSTNPVLIQDAARSLSGLPPLFLVHDASGSISDYFQLGPLGCRVYGIYDPQVEGAHRGAWHSIVDIAQAYAQLIKNVSCRGSILIGGWSYGGVLAVHIAHILNNERKALRVAGIILIDSVYPTILRHGIGMDLQENIVAGVVAELKDRQRVLLLRSAYSRYAWQLPSSNNQATGVCRSSMSVPVFVILIRASSHIPMENPDETSFLDWTRSMPQLGWEKYQESFVSQVLETSGDHFSIFDSPNVSCTRTVGNRLLILD